MKKLHNLGARSQDIIVSYIVLMSELNRKVGEYGGLVGEGQNSNCEVVSINNFSWGSTFNN